MKRTVALLMLWSAPAAALDVNINGNNLNTFSSPSCSWQVDNRTGEAFGFSSSCGVESIKAAHDMAHARRSVTGADIDRLNDRLDRIIKLLEIRQ